MTHRWSPGFTLIELLVVITIIGILTTVGAMMFANTQRNARDTVRQASVKQMQTAMEQYYASNDDSYTNGCTAIASLIQGGMPQDPSTDAPLGCVASDAEYCVYADLEKDEGNCTVAGTTCTLVTTANGTHFCNTALQ